jgi:hypothetical protein
MRFLIRPALALAVMLTFAAVGTGSLVSAPAAHAAGGCSPSLGASGNGTTIVVTGSVTCSSSSTEGGGSTGGGTVPPCWLAPRLTGKSMYQLMQTGNTGGLSSQQFFLDIPKPGEAAQYKNAPATQGVWWVPVSDGTAAGNACAYALYWPVWGPPPTPGATVPGFPVMNVEEASAIAFKHLQLPNLNVELNPATKSYVNLPTWVYSNPQYPDPVSATATISIPVIGYGTFSVSATVTATEAGGLQISLPSGGGAADDNGCGNWGSDSQSGGLTCGVTFTQPSGNAPFPVTVSTTWNITGPGVDTTRTDNQTVNATVYEVQSVNGG